MLTVTASAPAKLVLSGEYAVLYGAPAIVLAVDREVRVRVSERDDGCFSLLAPGVADAPEAFTLVNERPHFATPVATERFALVSAVMATIGLPSAGADIEIDSRQLFIDGRKLGLGSSAAVCVALAQALGEWRSHAVTLSSVQAIHRAAQSGRGSGVDLAAAWYGGLLHAERDDDALTVAPLPMPRTVLRMVDTGVAQSTPAMLAQLEHWAEHSSDADAVIGALCQSARTAAAAWQAGDGIAATECYSRALQAFDDATGLGIVSPAHRRVAAIAADVGVAYKPSGAGGGDVGVALAAEPESLQALDNALIAAGLRSAPIHSCPPRAN
ncbi:MAG: hypothetical protein AAGH76_12395 [Pseudomonadota bacterium]